MKYKAYIFDLDGTLLDTLADLSNAVNYALRQKNYPERTMQEVKSFIGNGIRKLIERAVPEGISAEDYEETYIIFNDYYLEHIADNTKAYKGIEAVVDELKKRGCKTGVLSNKAHRAAEAVVKDFFGDKFDIVVGKMKDFPTKPCPDSLNYVIKMLKVNPDECIYVGDSEVDIETAHNAGLPCISVTWGNRDRAFLETFPFDYMADTPEEILVL